MKRRRKNPIPGPRPRLTAKDLDEAVDQAFHEGASFKRFVWAWCQTCRLALIGLEAHGLLDTDTYLDIVDATERWAQGIVEDRAEINALFKESFRTHEETRKLRDALRVSMTDAQARYSTELACARACGVSAISSMDTSKETPYELHAKCEDIVGTVAGALTALGENYKAARAMAIGTFISALEAP